MTSGSFDPDLAVLRSMMVEAGVRRLYVKRLSPNDNSKNQIYLEGRITSAIPHGEVTAEADAARPRLKAPVQMSWLLSDGRRSLAPGAQLIFYPQYPEVRLSGVLRGCPEAPTGLIASRLPGRLLFLGVRPDGEVIGFATAADSSISRQMEAEETTPYTGVLHEVSLEAGLAADHRDKLLSALRVVHEKGWIRSQRLGRLGQKEECRGTNCIGFTLEAELGIQQNSRSEPDFEGWEIKVHTVPSPDRLDSGTLTLMTPEPTEGIYRQGVEAFIRKFGYQDRRGREDRINFGGQFRCGVKATLTRMTLDLRGFDSVSEKITDVSGGLFLVSEAEEVGAVWRFSDLLKHWNRKHARAAYVPGMKRESPAMGFLYGPKVRLGIGTDFQRFLKAVSGGSVFYDPALKIERASTGSPAVKRRNQFRIRSAGIPALYRDFETVELDAG